VWGRLPRIFFLVLGGELQQSRKKVMEKLFLKTKKPRGLGEFSRGLSSSTTQARKHNNLGGEVKASCVK